MKVIIIDDAGVQHERVERQMGTRHCLFCSLRNTCVIRAEILCMFAGGYSHKYYYKEIGEKRP